MTILVILTLIAMSLLGSAILFWITKLFKITQATFIRSMFVTLSLIVVNVITNGIGNLIAGHSHSIANLFYILDFVLGFVVLYLFYKKYYQTPWLKSLKIYITCFIAEIILVMIVTAVLYSVVFGNLWAIQNTQFNATPIDVALPVLGR